LVTFIRAEARGPRAAPGYLTRTPEGLRVELTSSFPLFSFQRTAPVFSRRRGRASLPTRSLRPPVIGMIPHFRTQKTPATAELCEEPSRSQRIGSASSPLGFPGARRVAPWGAGVRKLIVKL
jgi:hypothetical protein